jgi:CubicO group peptidase (beta-lactamase class C family)
MSNISGLRSNAKTMVQRAIDEAVADGKETGIQVAAYLKDELVVDAWAGTTEAAGASKVDGDTLFPVFSVTKAITATALHIQAERGLIDYDQPIARYWPEYGTHGKERTTVRHALTHRAGIPQMPAWVTPEKMCDWDWMVTQIAELSPVFEPGTTSAYLSMTFGWIIGECVCRTDPKQRSLGRFVREELAAPLAVKDLWIGIPNAVEPRIAKLTNPEPLPYAVPDDSLFRASMPSQVELVAEVFERPDVRRACVPGVGGIMNARSVARVFAMLANGGQLGGVRLLSPARVRSFSIPRERSQEVDSTFGTALAIGIGGYWLADPASPTVSAVGPNSKTICHPGAGGSIAWADPDARLSVAICHNRMFNATTPQTNHHVPIADALRHALEISS